MKRWMLGAAVAMMGCNGGEEPDDEDPAFFGVYVVDSYTENDTDCGAEGPDVDWGFTHFEIASDSFFGIPITAVHGCDGPEGCGDDAEFFFEETDASGATGTAYAWSAFDGECSITWTENILTVSGTSVTVERRYEEPSEVVLGADIDACEVEADTYSGGRDCTTWHVLKGTLVP